MKSKTILPLIVLSVVAYNSRPITAGGESPSPYSSSSQQTSWHLKNKQFARLWLVRHQIKVARYVIPFAVNRSGNNANLRTRAVIALGRLEDPIALPPLKQLLVTLDAREKKARSQGSYPVWPDRVPRWRIRIAIARIGARNLTGEAKLMALSKSIGLTWPQVRGYGLEIEKAIVTRRNLHIARDK